MDHAHASELFSAYWERDLGADETRALEEHLSSCVVCRREYVEFEKMLGGLRGFEHQIAPNDFVEGVIRRVRKRSRGRFFSGKNALNRIPYEMFSVVMLAILLAIYVVMQLSHPGRLQLP